AIAPTHEHPSRSNDTARMTFLLAPPRRTAEHGIGPTGLTPPSGRPDTAAPRDRLTGTPAGNNRSGSGRARATPLGPPPPSAQRGRAVGWRTGQSWSAGLSTPRTPRPRTWV